MSGAAVDWHCGLAKEAIDIFSKYLVLFGILNIALVKLYQLFSAFRMRCKTFD